MTNPNNMLAVIYLKLATNSCDIQNDTESTFQIDRRQCAVIKNIFEAAQNPIC